MFKFISFISNEELENSINMWTIIFYVRICLCENGLGRLLILKINFDRILYNNLLLLLFN